MFLYIYGHRNLELGTASKVNKVLGEQALLSLIPGSHVKVEGKEPTLQSRLLLCGFFFLPPSSTLNLPFQPPKREREKDRGKGGNIIIILQMRGIKFLGKFDLHP